MSEWCYYPVYNLGGGPPEPCARPVNHDGPCDDQPRPDTGDTGDTGPEPQRLPDGELPF